MLALASGFQTTFLFAFLFNQAAMTDYVGGQWI